MAIDTPGGNLSLKIKSRAQQITLNPNMKLLTCFVAENAKSTQIVYLHVQVAANYLRY